MSGRLHDPTLLSGEDGPGCRAHSRRAAPRPAAGSGDSLGRARGAQTGRSRGGGEQGTGPESIPKLKPPAFLLHQMRGGMERGGKK